MPDRIQMILLQSESNIRSKSVQTVRLTESFIGLTWFH